MLINIAYGLPTMALCLLLESFLLVTALRYYQQREIPLNKWSFWPQIRVIGVVMILLVIGNLAQVGIWAVLFRLLGEFPDFNAAFYHSAVNFATLGYGDVIMSARHKLLGPLEAMTGVLMIGVSTAVLMAAFQSSIRKRNKL